MFPAVYGYLSQALAIYSFERADGAGRAADLVVQTFVRFTSVALFPVIFCAGLLYMLVSIMYTVGSFYKDTPEMRTPL